MNATPLFCFFFFLTSDFLKKRKDPRSRSHVLLQPLHSFSQPAFQILLNLVASSQITSPNPPCSTFGHECRSPTGATFSSLSPSGPSRSPFLSLSFPGNFSRKVLVPPWTPSASFSPRPAWHQDLFLSFPVKFSSWLTLITVRFAVSRLFLLCPLERLRFDPWVS